MKDDFAGLGFAPADILLPQNCDLQRWAVVACDQYTAQPEYWERVQRFVGQAPSALHLVLPESCLDGPDVENDIMEINSTMTQYLRTGRFRELPHALIYVERTLRSGAVRRGLVGMVDLEQYDYEAASKSPIRATEGTVLSRIPPRVAVRKNAPIELPHAMLLCNDPEERIIEPLSAEKSGMEKLYSFTLMEGSGAVEGWLLTEEQQHRAAEALWAQQEKQKDAILFTIGDGNHSLASAKECYERQKRLTPQEHWAALPARWALVELCNLHDEALVFTPIHRTVFDVEPLQLLDYLVQRIPDAQRKEGTEWPIAFRSQDMAGGIDAPGFRDQLPVVLLQQALDEYVLEFGGRIDYVHGADVAERLAKRARTISFFLPPLDKNMLFPAIGAGGPLPRKTFSVGEAHDKRFYLEARRIR